MTGKLTKSQSKYIKSLQQKKYRDLNKQFVVEGIKMIREALEIDGLVDYLIYTGEISDYDFPFPASFFHASPKDLEIISSLKSPNRVLAVCNIRDSRGTIDFEKPILALDDISDPGNFGTIIRLADWFGITQLICTPNSVDPQNPKVVQASMGGIFRSTIWNMTLEELISELPPQMSVYRADMKGENLYSTEIKNPFMLIMGSESHGVSPILRKLVPNAISIPRFGGGESLNVAVSTGIILSEFKRKLS